MGKGKRLKRQRKNRPPSENEIFNIFFSDEGLEELTDELYNELLNKGWSEEDLRFQKNRGNLYCRSRNSFFDDVGFFGDE